MLPWDDGYAVYAAEIVRLYEWYRDTLGRLGQDLTAESSVRTETTAMDNNHWMLVFGGIFAFLNAFAVGASPPHLHVSTAVS